MQGYHDMFEPNKENNNSDQPRWILYAALVGAGFVAGMLGAQILALLI